MADHRITPGEKRRRGFLSGDPERIERSLRRSQSVGDREIHVTLARNRDAIITSLEGVSLPADVRADIDAYFAMLDPFTSSTVEDACACQQYQGDPRVYGSALQQMRDGRDHGDPESLYLCPRCSRMYVVGEDVGSHGSTFHWSPTDRSLA